MREKINAEKCEERGRVSERVSWPETNDKWMSESDSPCCNHEALIIIKPV